jgi:WD40 repeat protein
MSVCVCVCVCMYVCMCARIDRHITTAYQGLCRLYSGSWDKTIKVWDVETGECIKTLSGHDQVCPLCVESTK